MTCNHFDVSVWSDKYSKNSSSNLYMKNSRIFELELAVRPILAASWKIGPKSIFVLPKPIVKKNTKNKSKEGTLQCTRSVLFILKCFFCLCRHRRTAALKGQRREPTMWTSERLFASPLPVWSPKRARKGSSHRTLLLKYLVCTQNEWYL